MSSIAAVLRDGSGGPFSLSIFKKLAVTHGGAGCTMARPFYPHEADDPDLDWLVSNFLYECPDYIPVESGMLPLVLIPYQEEDIVVEEETADDKAPIKNQR